MHRLVARPVGVVILGLGAAMAACALLGAFFEATTRLARPVDSGAFGQMMVAAGITAAVGLALRLWGRSMNGSAMSRREAVLTVNAIWISIAVLGGLPYVFGAGTPLVDAVFESVSGFTTTGATIVGDIEGSLSHTLLLWRSLSQWLGGMGVVVLFVAVFPGLGISGKHLFRSEVPGVKAEGLQPRIAETSLVLWRFYLVFTLAEVLVLWLLGMDLFESVNHAWTTMSTGGFSTRNGSIGAFDSAAIEMVVAVFMLAAGVNFGLYFAALGSGGLRAFVRSVELRVYLGLAAVITLVLGIALIPVHGQVLEAGRHSFFMVATTLTSTGFGVDDYTVYPPFGLLLLVAMMFVGGCSGSTAGGIKVSRLVLLIETTQKALRRSIRPQVVQVVRLDGKPVEDNVLLDVATFFFLYMACLLGGCILVALLDGVSAPAAFGAMLTSVSNMGPAPFHEVQDNFVTYSPISKLVFCAAMILGRLEFLTVMALLLPDFWRR